MTNLRLFAITLLDDENGINADAFNLLVPELAAAGHQDILGVVKCQDNRYFLGEYEAEVLLNGPHPDYIGANCVPDETPLGEQIESGGELPE